MSRSPVLLAITAIAATGVIRPRACEGALYPIGKATLRVIDEAGKPVVDAEAGISFSKNNPPGKGWGTRLASKRGLTDKNGTFTATGSGGRVIYYSAWKAGYYRTVSLQYDFKKKGIGVWLPWNPTLEVVLRKKHKPIPMYAKKVETKIPLVGKPVGYDLRVGDWVTPHGKGKVSDFVFTLTQRWEKWENFEIKLQVAFSNQGDGIQQLDAEPVKGSVYRHHYEAPARGYLPRWTKELGKTPQRGRFGLETVNDKYLVFRVRSKLDAKGNVAKALHGKIAEGFRVTGYAAKQPTIIFVYYLNPFWTRNVEFDPDRNLFGKDRWGNPLISRP